MDVPGLPWSRGLLCNYINAYTYPTPVAKHYWTNREVHWYFLSLSGLIFLKGLPGRCLVTTPFTPEC